MTPPLAEKLMRAKDKTCSEANGTWAGSRETNLHSGLGRTFFLTFLFIELKMRCIGIRIESACPTQPGHWLVESAFFRRFFRVPCEVPCNKGNWDRHSRVTPVRTYEGVGLGAISLQPPSD